MKSFKLKEHELASSVGQDKTVQHQNVSVKLWLSAGLFSSFCFESELGSGRGHLLEVPVVVFTLPRGGSCPLMTPLCYGPFPRQEQAPLGSLP